MVTTLARLLEALRRVGLDEFTAEELAETIWLAALLRGGVLPETEESKSEVGEQLQPQSTAPTVSPESLVKDLRPSEPSLAPNQWASLYTRGAQPDEGRAGVPFHTPAGSALPNYLQLTRILRPLRRRVPSPNLKSIDEEATAKQIAETGVWLPVLKPNPVRWLELAFVIDESPSMRIWKRTVAELRRLLEQLGGFRDIRQWFLYTGGRDQSVALRTYEGGMSRHHKELINPALPRLILVVTDCVSPAWQGQELLDWLNAWGQKHPVGLVQMLPQKLWPQTRLHTACHVRAVAPAPAAANRTLSRQYISRPWQAPVSEPRALPIPVTTLEPESMLAWVHFITGSQTAAMPAFIGRAETGKLRTPQASEAKSDRLEQFRQVASPEAFRLACYFAAAPLRLPIMRLVQQVMLPQSHQTHLAEFFLSGLIRRISGPAVGDPDEIDYDFIGNLRHELLRYNLQSEAFQVDAVVGDYINEHYGGGADFGSVLASDEPAFSQSLVAGQDYFARVKRTVLERMDSPFSRLEQNRAEPIPPAVPSVMAEEPGPESQRSDLPTGRTPEAIVQYTTAKIVLVGDSGAGKTGLGWRLAHGMFKEHSSTHGPNFWTLPELGIKRADGTECEAVLWDLAGQHAYRQIHSIFLENVAAALVLFDPSNREDPLKGVRFWLEQLKGKGQLPPTVLVGARVDRGAPALSQQELDQFCQRYGVSGGYISTSAKSSEGLEALLERLKALIPWDEMTATVTTVTFKRIRDYVLALKERPDRVGVLVSPLALREQLQATDEDWRFTDAEMMTAVAHLETHGYVAVLHSSAGEQHILLTPELLMSLASSIVLLADKHPRELGAVSETELLQGKPSFDELKGLSQAESQILLDAAILRFLQHNICFRETLDFGNETLLIFPGLIKQKRPLQDDLPSTDDISYVVQGTVENLYASLVVLLGYTPSFTRINQWQNQAQYEMGEGEICGFRLIEDREGEIELVLYYGDQLPASGRVKFQELFEQFLYQRNVEVTRFPPVVCANGHQQDRNNVIKRVREQKSLMFCDECGDKITLPNFDKPQTIGIGASSWLQHEEATARLRTAYEVQLTKVKGYRRDWAVPRCYVSHHPEQATWAKELIKDLRDAGVYVVEQAAQVQADDFVVVLDTPAYQKAFTTPSLAADAPLVRARFGGRQLISLALTGQADAHEFKGCKPGSFCDETHYPVSLFDLVLNLYAVPLTHAGFAPLRQALHEQWEQTLARKEGDEAASPLKVFISYSHKDEELKDELVMMLTGLQRRGIVDAWQDRRIEAGDEWNKSIQDAMNDCDLALLLVSPDYLASRFIQEAEQPKLLQRRQEMQLRVIPIIVRPCKWQSEPVLKDLQALPRDNKSVITFSKASGERDQVWTDIATVIEKRVKTKKPS